MKTLLLAGLDGANPLGFLAALGLLRVLDARRGEDPRPRLAWVDEGRWRPVLHLPPSLEDPVATVMADLTSWRDAPELALEYEKEGKTLRDLKPPPAKFREFMMAAALAAPGDRRLADFTAAYATDIAVDGTGQTKPTALHFTSGQQKFLEMVAELAAGGTAEDMEEALTDWRYASPLPVLRWDVAGERQYAFSASDPSKEKAMGVPGANWLAFQALPLFPSFHRGKLFLRRASKVVDEPADSYRSRAARVHGAGLRLYVTDPDFSPQPAQQYRLAPIGQFHQENQRLYFAE